MSSLTDVTFFGPSTLMATVADGRVFISIGANGNLFQLYHGGIIKHFCGTSLNHGVLLFHYSVNVLKTTGSLRIYRDLDRMNHIIKESSEML
jgi:hypothetical protein